jgi:methionyl-tRNA formyltransferase
MDTGPVLLDRAVAVDPDETAGELLARLAPIGADALVEAIALIADGRANPVAQDPARASYAPMLSKADGAIDFTRPAAAVAARVRGVDPWPGATAQLRGQVVKLFGARARTGSGAAGIVLAIDGDGVHVACGDAVVAIRELQLPGRKRLAAGQVAAGRGIAIGDVFGPC